MELKRAFRHKLTRWRYLMLNRWAVGALILSLLVVLPLVVIFTSLATEPDQTWSHIVQRLLPRYVQNTLLLMLGVGLLVFITGVGTAWIISMYRFPGRQFFRWALILPIAIPAYIGGFAWAGILDYTSPVYIFLRQHFGVDTGAMLFFNLLSLPGAIVILSLSLFPYVYLITRAYFSRQSASLLEVASSLGRSRRNAFFTLALPMARPAIVAGVSLALMEVLNDYGLVKYFGVDTFTTGIFSAWFAFSNQQAAMKLSSWLMFIVFALILTESFHRRHIRYASEAGHHRPIQPHPLKGIKAAAAVLACSLPLILGFLLPALQLIYWSSQSVIQVAGRGFTQLLANSFMLATLAAALVIVFSIFIGFSARSFPAPLIRSLAKMATLGYAIPGAVVAIGIMVSALFIDRLLISYGLVSGLIFSGSYLVLIYAYTVRFMAVGYNSIDSGLARLSPSLDEASLSLGRNRWDTLRHINLPLLRGAVTGGWLLVFIDVLKELPLTLILRPFNMDTLAIRAFEYASDERLAEASPAALVIILAGLLPVYILNRLDAYPPKGITTIPDTGKQ